MLKNYFKISWRNIVRSPFYSGINIFGLSVGIAFTFLIGNYVWTEVRVNKDLKNVDRQYLIQSDWKSPDEGYVFATFGPLGKTLRENNPGLVANYYRFDGITSNVSKGDKSFRENLQVGDSSMLNMFGFTLLHGDLRNALANPFSVVISKSRAIKYFGKTDVVGQSLTIESFSGTKHDFLITGVLDAIPKNSVVALFDNYPGDIFVSTDNLQFFGRNMDWPNVFIVNFIELQKGVSPKDLDKPIRDLITKNAPPQMIPDVKLHLAPLKEFYLSAGNGLVKKMIGALSFIALFILAMAIINFINMSVSRSATRMREIGIRKVLGSLKKQLIAQFIVESVIIVFLATAVAFMIYALTKNVFSGIVGKELVDLSSFPLYFFAFPFLFIVLIGFLAGIYPAFVLSSLKSVESLKGKLSSVKDNVLLRKSLIAFQFFTATTALIGAIIISKQVNFFLNGNLGYNKDYILSAQVPRDWTKAGVTKMEFTRNQLASIPQVKDVSLSYEVPDGNNSGGVNIYKFGTDSAHASSAAALTTDEHYLDLYKIPLKAGSFFEGHALDSGRIILNESAVYALGWKNVSDAVGQQIRVPGDPTSYTIRGVTQDFHFGSMQQKIGPIVFFNVQFATIYRYLSFKLNQGDISSAIDAIQKKWNQLLTGAPFEYRFMDETLARLYQTEIQLKKASYTATILAMIIVLLGVLGLVSLSIQKRTKEVGIRKVLGSSVTGVVALFIKEFLLVILLGGIIACPLAYLVLNKWLQNFAYKIEITAVPFVTAIISLGLITALMICVQTIKVANSNPAVSLRSE